jgi:hypothetical protein
MPFARIREMKSLPFSVFKRADHPCYSVSFKNEATGEYYPAISTRQKTEAEAVKTAFAWLRDGIPQSGCPSRFKTCPLKTRPGK